MTILLPDTLDEVLHPVFETLPFERAMKALVVTDQTPFPEASARVAEAVASPALADRPDLVAGIWLYVDELDKAHAACQDLATPTGAYWHAIVHRREGDFSNAHYWFKRAVHHPAMGLIDLTGGGAGSGTAVAAYDPDETIDRVARAHERGDASNPALTSVQHKEWKALFGWCVQQ
ncbi:MAG: hypothetical protein AAF333_14885 [Planctomycetota bacterium]